MAEAQQSDMCPFPPYLMAECTRVIRPEVMSNKKKSAKKWQEKLDKQSEKSEEKKRKREVAFVPPKENTVGLSESAIDNNEIADMTKSLKKKAKKFRKNEAEENVKIESYVASNEETQ